MEKGKEYHGRYNLSDCNDQDASGLERFASKEECEAMIQKLCKQNQGWRAVKCTGCRGWYIYQGIPGY